MWEELRAAGAELVGDPGVRCLVVTGEGLPSRPASTWPSVAAVNGHALGAGLQLALACDLRVLAADAVAGLLELRWGLLPDLGATEWLPRIVGTARARELVRTAARVDAAARRATRAASPTFRISPHTTRSWQG
jgi:enoyl-CoA hydratase/carnithine racemase